MSSVCGFCGSAGKLSRCVNCKTTSYCGRQCQSQAWAKHKLVCTPCAPVSKSAADKPSCALVSESVADKPSCALVSESATSKPLCALVSGPDNTKKLRDLSDAILADIRKNGIINTIARLFAGASSPNAPSRRILNLLVSWPIPSPIIVDEILKFLKLNGPILEIGSGRGLLAKLIQDKGGSITPTDSMVSHGIDEVPYTFTEVWPINHKMALLEFCDLDTVMFVWPSYNEPYAAETLLYFKGKHVIYIGEPEFVPGATRGCTADAAFFYLLKKYWRCIQQHKIERWHDIHDDLNFYTRRDVPLSDEEVKELSAKEFVDALRATTTSTILTRKFHEVNERFGPIVLLDFFCGLLK